MLIRRGFVAGLLVTSLVTSLALVSTAHASDLSLRETPETASPQLRGSTDAGTGFVDGNGDAPGRRGEKKNGKASKPDGRGDPVNAAGKVKGWARDLDADALVASPRGGGWGKQRSTLARSRVSNGVRGRGGADARERTDAVVSTVAPVDAQFNWPLKGRLTSSYGGRHGGLDIAVSYEPVYAAAEGEVVFAGGGRRRGYGRYVDILHADGYLTRYAHLSSMRVKAGDQVQQGQVIAISGDTGRSTGPHLHFEIRIGGATVDPQAYLP